MEIWLAAGVGVALGTLVVLLMDTQWWLSRIRSYQKQEQVARAEKQKLAAEVKQSTQKAGKLVSSLEQKLAAESQKVADLTEDNEALGGKLETADYDLEKLRGNMARLQTYSEELEAKVKDAEEEQQLLLAQLGQAQNEYDLVCQRLTAVEAERERLVQDGKQLEAAQAEVEQLRREQETAVAARDRAEARVADLEAQNKGLLRQLATTQAIGQRLQALEAKLDARLTALPQRRSADLLNLTQINGIGQTYADRLEAAGFKSVVDIASASLDALSDAVGLSESSVADWQAQARRIVDTHE